MCIRDSYGRVQLAYLLVIGLLKQVLPIPDVKTLLESQFEGCLLYTSAVLLQIHGFWGQRHRQRRCR